MNNIGKNIALVIVIVLLLIALFNMFQGPSAVSAQSMMPFSDFMARVNEGKVADVMIKGHIVTGHLAEGGISFSTYLPDDSTITEKLLAKNIKVVAQPKDHDAPTFWGVVLNYLPMIILIGFWIFFMRQMQSGNGKAMGFGRKLAK